MGKILFCIAVAYSLALLILSLVNIKSLPDIELNNSDKIFHAVAYCGLVIVWYLYYFFMTKKKIKFVPLLTICLCAVMFGIIIEILQGTTTDYRTEDVHDMLANFCGTLVACVLIVSMKKILERWKLKLGHDFTKK